MLKKIFKKIIWDLRGGYRAEEFWDEWTPDFMKDPWQRQIHPQHTWIVKVLNYEKPKTLLEVGCGFGRNIKYILENYQYPLVISAVDISSFMLTNARRYLKDYLESKKSRIKLKKVWRSQISFRKADILNLPFASRSFDMVLSHGVLMHVKPEHIKKAVTQAFRVSKSKLIVVEQNDTGKPLNGKPYQKINYYTYTYPYKSLFEQGGGKIEEFHRKGQLDWFLVKLIKTY